MTILFCVVCGGSTVEEVNGWDLLTRGPSGGPGEMWVAVSIEYRNFHETSCSTQSPFRLTWNLVGVQLGQTGTLTRGPSSPEVSCVNASSQRVQENLEKVSWSFLIILGSCQYHPRKSRKGHLVFSKLFLEVTSVMLTCLW